MATLLKVPLPSPFDLESTLYSGQAFRWRRHGPGRHRGFIDNTPVEVRSADGTLAVTSAAPSDASRIRHYFRLDASHERFLETVPDDPSLLAALARFPGLRLLRQDAWESYISFILSQNSNEAKIRRTIEALCRSAGTRLDWQGEAWFRFPSPHVLSALSEPELRATGMGYRAPFVHEAAARVADGRLDVDVLHARPYEESFEALLAVPGIGEKVADCILLYGCDQTRAFPSDVWVRRLVRETYLRRRRPSYARLRELAWERFGEYAGYAQHYLFHYRRSVGELAATSPSK